MLHSVLLLKSLIVGQIVNAPNCHCCIDNSDVFPRWPGFLVGVKFDPSDAELLDHLAAKCGVGELKEHLFIVEFIPTLDERQGICYTHPENLPGAKKDGCIHFFHRTINAYATGQRKRRKIHNLDNTNEEHVRWYVVSKISYQQQKQTEKNDDRPITEEPDKLMIHTSPRTPKTVAPNPPRPCKSMLYDDIEENMHQEAKFAVEGSHLPKDSVQCEDNSDYPAWLAAESQTAENSDINGLDDFLLCNELLDSSSLLTSSVKNRVSNADGTNETK